ncbi:MAG: DUF4188 domain-containing protein [Dehalococcoidia bacterium]
MAKVIPGRFTAHTDEAFVVFIIGLRVNKFFAFRRWIPAALEMRPMLRALFTHPEKGMLGAQTFFYWRGIALVQYWRSFDDLETFARDKSDPHLGAWRRFNKNIGSDGSVGIFHETFLVEAGKYEALYGNMPLFGLAASTTHVPATGPRETARRRLGGQSEPAIVSPVPPTESA